MGASQEGSRPLVASSRVLRALAGRPFPPASSWKARGTAVPVGRLPGPRQAGALRKRARVSAGVTLIELLVVVTIIALFAALVGPRLFRQVGRSRATAARAQINSFQTAIGIYKLDTGQFPTTEQGLAALRVNPGGVERWDGPYLPQDAPPDPWGRPYVYTYPGEHGDEPDLASYGADGQQGGEGEDADIMSWSQ